MRKGILLRLALTILTLGLILSLILFAFPVGAQDLPDNEVTELRDQYSNTYDMGNGIYSTRMSLGSINYETVDGSYYPIQTAILSSSKSYWDWEVEAGHWQLYIKNDTTVQVKKGAYWVGQRLHGIAYLDVATKEYEILQTVYEQVPTVVGNTITWENLLYETDLIIRYTNDSFKEEIVIKQPLRDILGSPGYRPTDYGLNTATTYLVPIFETDWSNALPMRLADGTTVSPYGAEHEGAIYFESPTKDKYFDTNLVSFMPLDYAVSANPINPEDPEEDWEYASEKIRKRLIEKNGKHWLLTGVPVLALNQMPEGSIIFDPTETLRPNATGDETNLTPHGETNNWECVDEAVADDVSTYVDAVVGDWLRDLYNLPASAGEGTINKITLYFRVASEDSSHRVKGAIKSNSTVTETVEKDPYTDFGDFTWGTYTNDWINNPADSQAWEWSDIDALQIGIALKRPGGGGVACTQVYVVVDYTPINPPTVTTQAASSIEDTTATGNANITVTGGGNCDMRGGAWSTSTQDDPGALTPPEDYSSNVTEHGDFGTGAFTVSLTGLPTGDTIYFRPYAHNSGGWNWGTEVSFLTKPAAPTNVAASSNDETKVVITWTKSTGATDYHVFRGAVDLGASGNVSTEDDAGATASTISNSGNVTASDGTSTAHVELSLASEATGVTEHVYKVVASNASGDSDDSATDNGNRAVGAITYQWQVDDGGGYDNIVGGTTDPYNYTSAPAGVVTPGTASATDGTETDKVILSIAGESVADGATYDYQCIVSASGASNSPQTSDNDDGYRTTGGLTYAWQRSSGDADADYGALGGATTDPYNDTSAPAGSIDNAGTVTASNGTDTDKVVLSLAGESTANGVGRWYYCEVSATGATTQDTTHNRGYRTVGAITYQWQVDDGVGYDNIGGGTTDPYNYTGAPAGTITPGSAVATDGAFTSKVALNLAGESVADGASYTYQCILTSTGASNSPQTSDNDTGYRTTGALTYQWQVDDGGGYDNIVGGTTEAYDYTDAPSPTITAGNTVAGDGDDTAHVALSLAGTSLNDGTTYSYKCVLDATGCIQQTSASNTGETGGGSLNYQWEVNRGAGWGNMGGATASTYNDTAAPEGTISNSGTATASDGTETTHVVLSLAGEATTDGATNDYRCSLTSADAGGQTSGANTGYRTVGAITFQWYRSQTDADSAPWDSVVGGTTDPYNDTGAPEDGSGRWFYCVVSSVDADNTPQNSIHDRGYRLVALVVITNPCTGFDELWAIVNGEIIAGSNPITQTGFEYGLTDTYGANQTVTGAWVKGDEFWTKLSPLSPATVYHYRAIAYDDSWAYGEDRVFSTSGSATLYENLNTGGDGDSDSTYAANWTAMQFTSDNISHTVTSIRVPLKRVGDNPGTVTLAITHADSDNFSTGADLSYAILNGNAMTTGYVWYDFDITDITLDSSSKYVIVVKALSGNATDYIMWQEDSGGGLDNAVGSHSTDSGISWTTDSPTDYLFEIWGETVISLEGAVVFSSYIEEGDWLFALTYKNTYTPYYPNDNPEAYFYVQLVDDTTVKAQVNCPMWGYRPGSIYISKSLADTLEWGSTDYKVRLIGSFSGTPYTDYALEDLDWKGDEPTFLDRWVIAQANSIGDHDDITLTVDIADLGEVLNAEGHTMFSIGIPELNVVRPDLFEMVVRQPGYEETDWTHVLPGDTDWEVRLGPQVSGILTELGNLIDVDGKGVGGFLTFVAFMAVLCLLTLFGGLVVGLCLSYPVLLAGAWFGVIDWVLLGVLTFAVAVVFVYKVFLIK